MDLAAIEACAPPAQLPAEVVTLGVAATPDAERQGVAPRYCEWHIGFAVDQTAIWYADAKGELIAKMRLDSSTGRATPSFEQVDLRSGEIRATARVGSAWQLRYRADHDSALQQQTFALGEIEVLGPGFVDAVVSYWRELQAGERITVEFGSTVLQKTVALRLSKVDLHKCPALEDLQHCYWIEPANFFLRMFFDQIALGFNREQKLVLYRGVVNLQNAKGEKQALEIHYFHGAEAYAPVRARQGQTPP